METREGDEFISGGSLTQSKWSRTISHRLCHAPSTAIHTSPANPVRAATDLALPGSPPLHRRSGTMDITDEKVNGGPPMEIVDDVVSVRDRPFSSLPISPHFLTRSPDEAFAAKHMPDLGHDVKDFKVYTWRLAGWKKLEKKITSPEFDCGGHRWSVLLSPPLATPFRPLRSQAHTFIPFRKLKRTS